MKKTIKIITTPLLVTGFFAFAACDVDQTAQGEMPDVDVEGELEAPEYEVVKTDDGNIPDVKVDGELKLPKFDVDGPDVEVGSTKIEVPTVDVDLPDDDEEEGNEVAGRDNE